MKIYETDLDSWSAWTKKKMISLCNTFFLNTFSSDNDTPTVCGYIFSRILIFLSSPDTANR